MTDDEIRKAAERAGFWGVSAWWEDNIPRFRSFLEAAQQQPAVASTRHICQFCFHDWAEHYDGSKCPKCGKEQPAADTGAGDALMGESLPKIDYGYPVGLCRVCGGAEWTHVIRDHDFDKQEQRP